MTFKKIVARLLWHTRLCSIIKFPVENHLLRFHPSALSAALWVNPNDRAEDYKVLTWILRKGDHYVDVGANIGSLAIFSSIIVGNGGRVTAIEPNWRVMRFLIENLALNKCSNVVPIMVACGSTGGIGVLNCSGIKDDQAFITSYGPGERLRVCPLDELITEASYPIRLLKIDVEGFEEKVLLGGQKILKDTEFIYFEVCPMGYKTHGSSIYRIVGFLEEINFKIFEMSTEMVPKLITKDWQPNTTVNLLAARDGILPNS